MSRSHEHGIATRAIHDGGGPDPTTGAIITPICQSTTYVQQAVGRHKGFTYSRADNPTVAALEERLGALEDAPPAVCYSSGLSAITALFLAVLRAGDHVIVSDVVYGGTVRLLRQVLQGLGIRSSFVDTSRPEDVAAAVIPGTRLVLIESPGNPTLKLTDIEAVAKVAKAAGVLLAVDNTFLTAVLQRPLDLGADLSVYSTTKYVEGHNTTIGGAIVTRNEHLRERLRLVRKTVGSIQSPFEAWLTLKGLKTLPLRIRQHSRHAQVVAEWLERHPRVSRVAFPGLATFPQKELAARQHGAHGGIIAFEVAGDDPVRAGIDVMNRVRLCSLAENLGAVETLITHPASMTHGDIPRPERERLGITDGLVRLSVGLEEPEDIIADLDQALAGVPTETSGRSAREPAATA